MGGIATKENNNKKKISPELKNAFGLISSNKQEILESELEVSSNKLHSFKFRLVN